jgi:hypothetical protein
MFTSGSHWAGSFPQRYTRLDTKYLQDAVWTGIQDLLDWGLTRIEFQDLLDYKQLAIILQLFGDYSQLIIGHCSFIHCNHGTN